VISHTPTGGTRDEDDGAEQRHSDEEADSGGDADHRVGQQGQGDDRLGGAALPRDERAEQRDPGDRKGSVVKCTLFGAIIVIVCSNKGVTTSGGSEGVGRSVSQAVVTAFNWVFAFNYVFTQTLLAAHPRSR
jgi:hypothetical protein